MAGLIAQRRTEPTDDLIGGLVLARDSDDRLWVRNETGRTVTVQSLPSGTDVCPTLTNFFPA